MRAMPPRSSWVCAGTAWVWGALRSAAGSARCFQHGKGRGAGDDQPLDLRGDEIKRVGGHTQMVSSTL